MDDKKLSDRPPTPEGNDCCGNSCRPCIFDIHKRLLEQWEHNKNNRSAIKNKNLLVPTLYKSFEVIEINKINNDYITIILRHKNVGCIFLNPGQHVIINISTWSRPFTPITWGDNKLEILVRIYPKSVFTNKLKNLQLGDEIRIRGPYSDFEYLRNKFKKIVMFCMGSGIAAFYPIVKQIVEDELEETRVQLVAGFRSIDHVPLMKRLQLLTDYWNVECRFYLTIVEKTINIHNIDVKNGRIDEDACKSALQEELPELTLVLICGTNEFNESMERWTQECNFVNCHVFK